MKLSNFLNEADQVKAKDKKPKKIKPNKGNESPHPMRGKLVGEGNKPQKPKAYQPNKNQPNPVAKNSRNKSGAGAHKSPKDYDRKNAKLDIKKQLEEGPFVADRMEIINTILKELKYLAYDDIHIIRKLAKMIGKDIRVKDYKHLKTGSRLQLEAKNCGCNQERCETFGITEGVEEQDLLIIEQIEMMTEAQFDEAAGEKDACYHKVKSRYKVWPSAYASGALVQCRKKGAKNWGNSKKK